MRVRWRTQAPALGTDRAGGRKRPPASGRARADRRLGYLLVAPAVILLLAVTAYPLAYNLWNSFHAENLSVATGQGGFVGGDNYTKMFDSSEWVHALLERTLAFAGVSVALETVVALGLALMLHRRFRGRGAAARRDPDPVGGADGRLGDAVEDDVRPARGLRRLHLRPPHDLARRRSGPRGRRSSSPTPGRTSRSSRSSCSPACR